MRVGFITPALQVSSGWGRYSLSLIEAVAAHGVEAVVVATHDAPPAIDVPHAGYHRVISASIPGRRWMTPRVLLRAPAVRRLVRGCDLVHCTGESLVPLAALTGRPLVITAHGTYLPRALRRPAVRWLFAWAIGRAHAVICVSRFTESQVREALPGVKALVIHNGVHWQRFAAAAPPPEPKRGPVIVGVGQVKTRKGFHVVAEAMQTVRGSFPAAEYVVIGDTTSAPAFADQLAAMPGVRVLGRLDDATLRAWYHHADLLAQTPVNVGDKFEGFGLVFLEAGAAGLPSVGARGSGAEEAILHEETGLLVPQNDPAATTEAILRLLRDDALRARMGESARRHAMANGWDQIAAQVMQVYASALA